MKHLFLEANAYFSQETGESSRLYDIVYPRHRRQRNIDYYGFEVRSLRLFHPD